MRIPVHDMLALLGAYVRPQRGRVALLAMLLVGSIALQLLNPQIIRVFLDTAQAGGSDRALLLPALAFIALALAQRGLDLASVFVGENTGWTATNVLRDDLTRQVLRLDMAFHKRHTPGELIARLDGDVMALGNFFSYFVLRLVGNSGLIVGILALLFRESWWAGLLLSAYTLTALMALRALHGLGMRRWSAQRQADAEMFGFLEERLAGTEDIRSSGAEAYTLRRFDTLIDRFTLASRDGELASTLVSAITNLLFLTGYALGLGIGAYLYTTSQATIGAAFVLVFYIGRLMTPLQQIQAQAQDLQRAAASIGRVRALQHHRPAVTEAATRHLPAGPLAVEFDHLAFSYHDEEREATGAGHRAEQDGRTAPDGPQRVLHGVTFALAPGHVLGLLGRTGSGKTTLSRLVFRLYDPDAGTIRLGGVDIRDVAFDDLRARVALVTQDVQIFAASIRDNLALFDRRIDDRRIAGALAELGLGEWVAALPDGLDTRLGPGGLGLSAGEAQLLAFARVFLRDPGLIILDEASSRLDPATERLMERAIDRLLAGRTAIIIAHRLGTVRRADAILILERGAVVEYGERVALAADPHSRFARLLRTGLEEVLA